MKGGCCYVVLALAVMIALIIALVVFHIIRPGETKEANRVPTTSVDRIEIYHPSKPCRLRKTEPGYLCICDSDYCDTLDVEEPTESKQYILVTTSDAGDRFSYIKGAFVQEDEKETPDHQQSNTELNPIVRIDQSQTYQEIFGFGGAISGAVSYVFDQLPQSLRECIYKSYYSNDVGMGYSLIRMPIASSDFDFEPWYYNESPKDDIKLSNFTKLDQRDKVRNDQIKDLIAVTNNSAIKIFAAAWNPPTWMKTVVWLNNTEEVNLNLPWLKKNDSSNSLEQQYFLNPKYYQSWTDYHLKWIDLMFGDGIPIYSVSTGNEPYYARFIQPPGILFPWQASEHSKWIENLGSTLNASKYRNVQIHGYDDIRTGLIEYMDEMNKSNPNAMDYISMIGVHGYTDWCTSASILDETHKKYPNKPILYTETCQLKKPEPYKAWRVVMRITSELIDRLKYHVVGHIDWNLCLDASGGPRYFGSLLGANILANENFTEISKLPIFYAMAHFSKFIPAGSRRIDAKIREKEFPLLEVIAFSRPDQKVSVILHNNNTETMNIRVVDSHVGSASFELKPKSVNTLIYSID